MRKSVAQLEAALAAMTARAEGAESALASLQSRIKHDYIERAEYNRVQALLRTTQQFCSKYKNEARPGEAAAASPRRAAMLAAREEAMRSGRCVTVAL